MLIIDPFLVFRGATDGLDVVTGFLYASPKADVMFEREVPKRGPVFPLSSAKLESEGETRPFLILSSTLISAAVVITLMDVCEMETFFFVFSLP
jgi:hypothetical protein